MGIQVNGVEYYTVLKTTEVVGSQSTSVDNVSNIYLAEIDVSDGSYHDCVLEVKIIQAAGDESANDFTLFWGFSSVSLTTNSPTQLAASEFSLICDLTAGGTTRYYHSVVFKPKGLYLNVWYDCDNLTVALTSVDVNLMKVS